MSETPKLALFRQIKQAILHLENEHTPTGGTHRPAPADPEYPAQLPQSQSVTVPPDGLCLSYACIAASMAQRWQQEHGEQGFRTGHDRALEQAELVQARLFRDEVARLMREYTDFDHDRICDRDRAASLAQGRLPELEDLPFYAACLNGCIEVVPLGYADYQNTMIVGQGPLRISVGNVQAIDDAGGTSNMSIRSPRCDCRTLPLTMAQPTGSSKSMNPCIKP